ncbi:hypothetical protein SAMN05216388_10762 [Halorientalis persicus]|uniref:PQQ-like domain-containing protein n=1 Tax=Halorientalis persicus TaxID=1367881 RepID=A0A1H8WV45_9EURY|nr:hypothetical protein [Halorientalis persicus]SEP30958.1 hypothetical protein SAMN05216388_10762 [Halorientalis persicus]
MNNQSRRDVLKRLGEGALAVTGLGTVQEIEVSETLPGLAQSSVDAQTASTTGGQFMGDSMNTGYLGAGITPTGVKEVHRKPSQDFVWRSPTASSQGVFAAPYEGRVEVLDNKANMIQEFSAMGRPTHPIFEGNIVSWADGEAIKGFDYTTGEKIGEISVISPGEDMFKAGGSAFAPVAFSSGTAISKFDPTTINAESGLGSYDGASPKTYLTENGDFIYYAAAGNSSGLAKHRVSDDMIVERNSDFDSTSRGYSMDGENIFLSGESKLKVFDTNGLERLDESPLSAIGDVIPVLVQEENQTKVYVGDNNGLMKGFTFDGSLTEDWTFETGDGVVEAVGMGDAIVASTNGDTYGVNRHTGELLWSVEDEIGSERGGRLGLPYSNFLPLADKRGGFSVLEFETVSDGISALPSNLQRFDTNGQAGIQADEIINAIVAYNSGSQIGGQPVSATDVVDLIVEYNS